MIVIIIAVIIVILIMIMIMIITIVIGILHNQLTHSDFCITMAKREQASQREYRNLEASTLHL